MPVADWDEYNVNGYATTLGSAIVPTNEAHVKAIVDSWSIEKVNEARAIIIETNTIVEFCIGQGASIICVLVKYSLLIELDTSNFNSKSKRK